MKIARPFNGQHMMTQSYDEHVARAKVNGWCSKPVTGCKTYYYGGVDWAMPEGTSLIAAASGDMEWREDKTGYGKHVRLTWNEEGANWTAIYGHMSSKFFAGQTAKIEAGQMVGYSGNTGNSTGPHLHFELRRNGIPVDPEDYFFGTTINPVPDPQPDQEPIEKFEKRPIPQLPKVKVTALPWLNIRIEPGNLTSSAGRLNTGDIVEVMGYVDVGNDTWLKIGEDRYIAAQYDGETMVQWAD